MSFIATLNLDGLSPISVKKYSLTIIQEKDVTGFPHCPPTAGEFKVMVPLSKQTDPIMDWALSPNMKRKGTLIFYSFDGTSVARKLRFTDAYCTYYKEDYIDHDTSNMMIKLVVSCQMFQVGESQHENNWPTTLRTTITK